MSLLFCIAIGISFNLLSVCSTQCTNCDDCKLQLQCEANPKCLWSNNSEDNLSKCIANTNPCPYITVPSLNRAIPLNKCMKLDYNSNQYTLFTCYNDIVYKEEYMENNCSHTPITSIKTNDYHNYNCKGSIESCNYVKLLSFEKCLPTNYSIDNTPIRYTLTYELTHQIYETSDTNHYISTCSHNTYSITTDTDETYPHCIDGERVFVDECHTPWISDINCGYIFDFDEEHAVPLDTCNTKYDENISYEYQCQDSKIYKCIHNDIHCKGICTEYEYTGYDIADCDISTCPMVQYNVFGNCQHKRESKSIVVDVCMNDMDNRSVMWKCKGHSMAKYVYNGISCDTDHLINTESMVFDEECHMIKNEYISMEIVSCSSPKCRLTQNINSYEICNIFDSSNIDQVIPFWDTYYDDYCDWFGDNAAFDFNIYQCNTNGLTLSLSAPIVSGSLNTTHHSWPNDLYRLNLNDLGLNGEWNWWALTSDTLEYIDISNNNFSGTLSLLPLLYSDRLETVKISNNPLMSGYMDWQWMGYMSNRYLNAFSATDIAWNGYADFTLIPQHKKMFIELDKTYHCNPYKYLCKAPLVNVDRSNKACGDRSSCEATCQCSDGSIATPTHFPFSPVLGVISCGDTIDSAYGVTRNIWGDNGHYYLIHVPNEYGEINITFDARYSPHFKGRIVVYSVEDVHHNSYRKVYDMNNPLKLTISLRSDSYYYLQIIANTSIDGMHCMEHDTMDRDEYWYLFNEGFYQSGYQCDYSLYEYSISMDGCTMSPTPNPTLNPTIFYSTTGDIITDNAVEDVLDKNVIFDMNTYVDGWTINDVYGRIEISVTIWIKSELQMDGDCLECFEWLLRDMDHTSNAEYVSLNEYYGYNHQDITFYNTQTGLVIMDGIVYDVIDTYLIITSIRTHNAGYCVDKTKMPSHVLYPGKTYRLKLAVSVNTYISVESEPILLTTHSPPTGGTCIISLDDDNNSSDLWNRYTLSCSDWNSHVTENDELRYNILYENVPFTKQYKSNPLSVSIGGCGDTIMTALIQDAASIISCYDVVVSFPAINNSNIDDLTRQISNTIYLSDIHNRIDIVSIFGTIRGVLASEYITAFTYKTYYDLSDTLFDVLLSSSVVLHSNYSVSLQDILHEVSTLIVATHPDGYIGSDALQMLIHSYTSKLLQSVKYHFDDIDLYAMSIALQGLIENLNSYVSSLIAEPLYINELVPALIGNTLHASHLALLRSYPGEIFNYSVNNKEIMAQKFKSSGIHNDDNKIKCGFDAEYVLIPNEITTEHMIFDCSFLRINTDDLNESNIISVNLYDEDSHLPINVYRGTSNCDPYLITFKFSLKDNVNYSLYQNTALPICSAWNNNSDDCFVYDIKHDMNEIICGCTHLGTHDVISESYIIIPNVIPSWNWRNVSLHNLDEYHLCWMSVVVLLAMIICLCGLKWMDKTINRPILAYEDVIFIKSRNERMKNDISGKEIECIEKYLGSFDQELFGYGMCSRFPIASLCTLHSKLFMVYLWEGHIFLSILCRPSGSNISIRTRIALLFMYLCTVMALTSLFYGLQLQICSNHTNGVFVSFIISLLSIFPVYCIKQLFAKSKPKTVRKTIYLYEDIELKRVSSMNDELDDESILDYLRDSHRDRLAKYEHCNLNQVYTESLTRIKRNSIHEKISTLDIAVEELRKTNSNVHRLQLVDDIRVTLFNTLYPFPHFCKCIAWLLLIFWTGFVAVIAILFSLQFDLKYESAANPNSSHLLLYEKECWQNNRALWIESQLSYKYIDELNDNMQSNQSMRWFTSCGTSMLLYILLIEPIFIYIATWLKMWMFSHNLSMKISVHNLEVLCRKVCLCSAAEAVNTYRMTRHDTDMTEMTVMSGNGRPRRRTSSTSYNMVHPDRPLDVFGYLCNDDLFLRIDSKSGKLRAIDDNENSLKDMEAPSIDIAACNDFDDEYYNEYRYEDDEDDDNATVICHDSVSSHGRQQSYTDLSVTVTENGEFDSRELAMMRVAAGNIFDYKADVIHEGNEMEEEDSNFFSFDLNSDGIEESDDIDDDEVVLSQMQMDVDFNVFDEFDDDDINIQIRSETLTKSETDDDDDEELIDTITVALSDDSNKDFHERHSTESILTKATNILTATLYSEEDNDQEASVEQPIINNDDDDHQKRHHQKKFFAE